MGRPKKIKKIPQEANYTLSVKVFGKFHVATGATFDEALANLKIPNAKGLSVWRVEFDGKTRERIVQPITTYRIFNTQGLTREVALKNFRILFGV